MFARRGSRFNRRGIGASGGASVSPLTLFPGNVLQWCRGDRGITIATGVSLWADQSGNGHDYAQAAGSAQPAYNATGLNGRGTLLFDGSNDLLTNATLNLPAPGTTPTTIILVAKQVSWTAGDRIWGGTADNGCMLSQNTVTPQIRQSNGANVNANSAGTIGSWFRILGAFGNSTADRCKVGATNVTGGNALNTDPAAGRSLGASTGAAFSNVEIAELIVLNTTFANGSASELALSAYITATWGATVGV